MARRKRVELSVAVGGEEIPPELLDVNHPVWQDDAADDRAVSPRARDAARLCGRRNRHRAAVREWAVEAGWTRDGRIPDLRRLREAGLLPDDDLEYRRSLYRLASEGVVGA